MVNSLKNCIIHIRSSFNVLVQHIRFNRTLEMLKGKMLYIFYIYICPMSVCTKWSGQICRSIIWNGKQLKSLTTDYKVQTKINRWNEYQSMAWNRLIMHLNSEVIVLPVFVSCFMTIYGRLIASSELY